MKELTVPDRIAAQLSSLSSMSRAELLGLWQRVFQAPVPPQLRRHLVVRFLAHRIQESEFRELSAGTRKRLRQMGKTVEKDLAAEISPAPAFKPGTRLIRQWRDQTHVVTVTDKNYEYQGSYYQSLSEIARLITGSRRSGPLFFGMKSSPANASASPGFK
jgi:hypothetical protein